MLPADFQDPHKFLPLPLCSTLCGWITVSPTYRFRKIFPNAAQQPSAVTGLDRDNLARRAVPVVESEVIYLNYDILIACECRSAMGPQQELQCHCGEGVW